jgi:cell division protein FtsB
VSDAVREQTGITPRTLKVLAWVQVPLILLAVIVYAWVFWSLRPLLERQENLRTDIEAKQRSVAELRGEIEAKTRSVAVLREQAEQYSRALKQAQTTAPPGTVTRATPITALVTPRAERRPTEGRTSDGRPLYVFSAWIQGPPEVVSRIAAVQWEFNHPTFRNPVMRSADRGNGFRVSYTGWGCLSSVIVTFDLAEPRGEPPRLDFDMCGALGT